MTPCPEWSIQNRWMPCALVALLAGSVAASAQETTEAARPYNRISTRNVFGSKPPPPPAPVEAPPEPPKERPDFFLSGFTRKGGQAKAFISYQIKGKPMEFPEPLLIGVEVDGIKLLEVDESTESVRIEYNGEELTLDFDKNGVKAVAAPSGAVPGLPGAPGNLPTIQPNAPRGSVPPPPVPAFGNQLNFQAPGNPGGFGNAASGPTVVGRGGTVLGGFNANSQGGTTANGLSAIQAGGIGAPAGLEVPAVQPAPGEFGSTIPSNPTRRVAAPFPSFPTRPN
jgi:hypothetical protein